MSSIRNALEKCMELGKKIDESLGNDESTVWNCRYERSFANSIVEIAKSALAKPPLNCEVFTSESEMKSAFIDYYNEVWSLKGTSDEIDYCDLKHNIDGILHDYIEWLLSPMKSKMD
jgi:hypothetical protein